MRPLNGVKEALGGERKRGNVDGFVDSRPQDEASRE